MGHQGGAEMPKRGQWRGQEIFMEGAEIFKEGGGILQGGGQKSDKSGLEEHTVLGC